MSFRSASISRFISTARSSFRTPSFRSIPRRRLSSRSGFGALGCGHSLLPVNKSVATVPRLTSHLSVTVRACCELSQGTRTCQDRYDDDDEFMRLHYSIDDGGLILTVDGARGKRNKSLLLNDSWDRRYIYSREHPGFSLDIVSHFADYLHVLGPSGSDSSSWEEEPMFP